MTTPTEAPNPAAPEAVPAPAEEASAPPPEAPTAALPAETPDPYETGADTFDRAYVEKLRKEAADRRVAHQPYEEAFGQYDDQSRAFFFDLAKGLASPDPDVRAETARAMQKVASNILPQAATTDPSAADPEAEKPLTRADLEAYQKEQKRIEAQEQSIQAVYDQARKLGYEPGTPGHADLLYRAANQTNGDLDAAHAAIQADHQAIIDKFVAEQQGAAGAYPAQPAGGTAPTGPGSGPPTDFESARRSMRARLAALK